MTSSKNYDPRMGDEDESESQEFHQLGHRAHSKHVRLDVDLSDGSGSGPDKHSTQASELSYWDRISDAISPYNPLDLKWVLDNWTWSKIKPVIRGAVVAWVSFLFVVIPRTEQTLGQVSSSFSA